MADATLMQRVDAVRRLARRGAVQPLAKVVGKMRAQDLAAVLTYLPTPEQRMVFEQVKSDAAAAAILTYVEGDDLVHLVSEMPPERLAILLNEMDPDDQTDILEALPEEKRNAILSRIQKDEREQVEALLGYPPDSAGGIMSPVALRLSEETTCRDAIAAVQEASDHELIYYIYVENEHEQLVGVTSLRSLLTRSPSSRMRDILSSDIITVSPSTDQEEVARIAGRYGLLAIPVVDESRKLLGIVTIDDVVDVIREEAAEDMLLMAGVNEPAAETKVSRLVATWRRLPWLLVTLVGGLAISELISSFSDVLKEAAVLASFMTVVTGMGGNVGVQSATLTIRSIAVGTQESSVWMPVVRELAVGVLLGITFGLLIGGYSYLRYQDLPVSLCLGAALLSGMTAATVIGTLVPLTLRRVGVDPAVATGPFVTTAIDAVGMGIYLSTASFLFSLLHTRGARCLARSPAPSMSPTRSASKAS